MKNRREIFEEIYDERERQIEKWGNDFDDQNTINDWVAYITSYATRGATAGGWFHPEASDRFCQGMVKVAALAIAAIEACERNQHAFAPRHYDSWSRVEIVYEAD
jgi:hypothetical protein